jgi:predicted Fe-Mo cluster-binding NifX family protein
MDTINLDPRYSTSDVPGKCIKCLAELELGKCLLELLRAEGDDKALAQRFEMLVSFLKSPESRILRDESERYLAEGKQVTVRISFKDGNPKYELKINW